MSSEYCPLCLESSGAQNLLRKLSVSFDEVIIVCSDPQCAFMKDECEDDTPASNISSDCHNAEPVLSQDSQSASDWLFEQVFSEQPTTEYSPLTLGQPAKSLPGHATGVDSGNDTATGSEPDSLSSSASSTSSSLSLGALPPDVASFSITVGSITAATVAVPGITAPPKSASVVDSTSRSASVVDSTSRSASGSYTGWETICDNSDVTGITSLMYGRSLPCDVADSRSLPDQPRALSEPAGARTSSKPRRVSSGLALKTLGGSSQYEPGVTRCYRYEQVHTGKERRENRSRLKSASCSTASTSPSNRSLPASSVSVSQPSPSTSVSASQWLYSPPALNLQSSTSSSLSSGSSSLPASDTDDPVASSGRAPPIVSGRSRRVRPNMQRLLPTSNVERSAEETPADPRVAAPQTDSVCYTQSCECRSKLSAGAEICRPARRPGLRPRKSTSTVQDTSRSTCQSSRKRPSSENGLSLEQMLSADFIIDTFTKRLRSTYAHLIP